MQLLLDTHAFDRMLAAQSDLEALSLVTRDSAVAQFGITTFW